MYVSLIPRLTCCRRPWNNKSHAIHGSFTGLDLNQYGQLFFDWLTRNMVLLLFEYVLMLGCRGTLLQALGSKTSL